MKITLLPDIQAKKEKHAIKKEHRRKSKAKQQKKRNSRYLKRRGFFHVFVTSLLATTLLVGGIGAGILYNKIDRVVIYSQEQIDEDIDLLRTQIEYYYNNWNAQEGMSEDEREKQFIIMMQMCLLPICERNMFTGAAGALYNDKGVKMCGTDETFGLIQEHFDSDVSYSPLWRRYYKAGNRPSADILEMYNDYLNKSYTDNRYNAKLVSGYIDGDVFYYGKIAFYEPGETGASEEVMVYDCSPTDTDGMQKIDEFAPMDRTGEYDHYIPVLHKTSDVTAESELESIYMEFAGDEQLPASTTVGEEAFYKYTLQYSGRIQVADDKEYILVLSFHYDCMKENGAWIVRYCISFGVVILLLAFFIAKYRYVRLKAHYEFEDYQKNLTNAMAHDLKSPLMVISGMAENLKEQVHTEKRDYYAQEIMRLVGDMNHMIEQILGFSKLGNINKLENKEMVDMRKLIEEIVENYEELCTDDSKPIDVEGELLVEGDAVLLRQMTENLVGNALLHADVGVISIELSDHVFCIKNNYLGTLTQEDVPRLLQAFEKEESRKRTGGHGLGLSIVNQIVLLHGWNLTVKIADKYFMVCITI